MKESLILALVLVLSLGSIVLAAPPDNFGALPNHLGQVQPPIDIDVIVEEFAHVGYLDTTPMTFSLTAPDSTGDTVRQSRQFVFAANTDVYVDIEENVSKSIYDSLVAANANIDGPLLLAYPYIDSQAGSEVGGPTWGAFSNGLGAKNRYAFAPGYYDETITLAYGWNAFPYIRGGQATVHWDDYSWWLLEAKTYEGTLTVTISAQ